jgi:hypothetical protein
MVRWHKAEPEDMHPGQVIWTKPDFDSSPRRPQIVIEFRRLVDGRDHEWTIYDVETEEMWVAHVGPRTSWSIREEESE